MAIICSSLVCGGEGKQNKTFFPPPLFFAFQSKHLSAKRELTAFL